MKAVVRVFLGVVWDLSVVWVSVKSPAAKVITVLPVLTSLGMKRAVVVNVQQNQDVLVEVVRCTHDYDCDVGEKCCLDVCTDTHPDNYN